MCSTPPQKRFPSVAFEICEGQFPRSDILYHHMRLALTVCCCCCCGGGEFGGRIAIAIAGTFIVCMTEDTTCTTEDIMSEFSVYVCAHAGSSEPGEFPFIMYNMKSEFIVCSNCI